ncbi:MAG: hypothetical protein JO036_18120 [Candidatus Eremiobacteraeota bacterium]|nr:hypothetical protein [Candidatus Eremiobacteraeota bacterium]
MGDNLDLLKELTEGEDEFDADLMACGCRYAAAPGMTQEPVELREVLDLYGLKDQKLYAFVETLIAECQIEAAKVVEVADKAARATGAANVGATA